MAPINAAVQGFMAAEHNLEKAASRIARRNSPPGDSKDTVSLSDEAVGLLSARNAYEMNLQVTRVVDSQTKKLLDLLA